MEILSTGTLVSVTPVLVGMMAGALCFVSLAQIPYWKSLPPAQFREEFVASGPFIPRYVLPLSILATTPVVVAAILLRGTPSFLPEVIAALALVVADTAHFATNKSTTTLLSKDPLTPPQITVLFGQSTTVATVRMLMGLTAAVCSTVAALLLGSR
jgi:hypothetical protein